MNQTKEKIVTVAIELFKKNGYKETSINKICSCCNLTKGTFYYYFNSKDEIINEYCATLFKNFNDLLPTIITISSAKEKLWKAIEYCIDKLCSLTIPLLKEILVLCTQNVFYKFDQTILEESNDSYGYSILVFYNLIIQAQNEGTINKKKDASLLMDIYYVAFIGTCLDWCSNHGKYDIKEKLHQAFTVIFFDGSTEN
ncbi:TetR/AcrR family transcriptional regulator [Terrisporobacter sp.]